MPKISPLERFAHEDVTATPLCGVRDASGLTSGCFHTTKTQADFGRTRIAVYLNVEQNGPFAPALSTPGTISCDDLIGDGV
jgi:hypothetical protein